MEEEAGVAPGPEALEFPAYQDQVVVLDPHVIALVRVLDDGARELSVHLLVERPVGGVEDAVREEVVEQGPEDLVGEAEVVLSHLFPCEIDRFQRIARLPGPQREEVSEEGTRGGFLGIRADPADP